MRTFRLPLSGSRVLSGSLVLALAVLVACGGGDDDDTASGDEGTGAKLGEAIGASGGEGSGEGEPSNQGTVAYESTTTTLGSYRREMPDLDPPTIPRSGSPPTTAPGTEPLEWPIGDGNLPLLGEFAVDLEHEGYTDVPVALTEGAQIALISAADDGILTHIEIFRPDGTSEGSWEGGEEGVVNGWEWVGEGDTVPMTGVYVIRVVHLGGSDEPFLLRFFG